MAEAFTAAGAHVGSRFNVVSTIPTLVLTGILGLLAVSGPPGKPPDANQVISIVSDLSIVGIGTLAVLVVTVGLVTHTFQTRLIKWLEGYSDNQYLKPLLERRTVAYRLRRDWLDRHGRSAKPLNLKEKQSPALIRRRAAAALAERASYPKGSGRIMPTRLGNALRKAEDHAGGDRYGLDAILWIPLVYPIMGPTMTAWLDDARNELDVNVRFVWVWSTIGVASFGLLAPTRSPWLVLPIASMGLAHLAYRASIQAADAYGVALARAIDLYRFEALERLRLALPTDHRSELKWFAVVEAMLKGNTAVDDRLLIYSHDALGAPRVAAS